MRSVNVPRPTGDHRYQAPSMRLGRSQFDLTHQHKTTFDAGLLVPCFLAEVVPGDTQTCKMKGLVRIFSPLDAPIMDDIEITVDFFFVPNRLIWTNWEYFLGAHDAAGAQDTDYTIPIVGGGYTVQVGSVAHYMGLPIGLQTTAVPVSAMPFRAYGLIYHEWYRDQNLIDGDLPDKDDAGVGLTAINPFQADSLFKSAKRHDYFTSALPYTQKGDDVTVALSGAPRVFADVSGAGTTIGVGVGGDPFDTERLAAELSGGIVQLTGVSIATANALFVDLSAGSVSIAALRESAAIQQLLERDARGGTRHPEIIRSHFGVDVPDFRTQRPEYLGGGRGFVNVSPVANTSATATEDQGQLAGIGAGWIEASWAKSFVEHGHVIGIIRARGQISYQQGVDRLWSRETKLDFLWPELSQLGEQAILNKEIFVSNSAATDEAVFGYQERYAEYRFKKSIISGKFDSNAAGALDFWHLAEDFASLPTLNQTFIEDATPMARVTTVDTEPDFIMDSRFDYRVARALPVRPVPTLGTARF